MSNTAESSTPDVAVGAYFYPLTTRCTARTWRSGMVGEEIGIPGLRPANEIELARQAQQLFEGHQQPNTYCIQQGNRLLRDWDDSNGHQVLEQLALAHSHGLSYFIFDSYTGVKGGETFREMNEARRITSLASAIGMFGFRYARMETLESPRVVLPIPYSEHTKLGINNGYSEPRRQYDITRDTARYIIDQAAADWQSPHYLRVGAERPYLSVLMPAFTHYASADKYDILAPFIDTLYEHAVAKYDQFPYIVGVMRGLGDIALWNKVQVDAITQYCSLPDDGPDIQQYETLADKRTAEWERFTDQAYPIPFVPSVSVGWDASPRGEQGYTLEQVSNLHPYTPIVVGNTSDQVARMLTKAIRFTNGTVPQGERFVTMFAWNEVSEGAALLPRIRDDGSVDNSYLEAVREVIVRETTISRRFLPTPQVPGVL